MLYIPDRIILSLAILNRFSVFCINVFIVQVGYDKQGLPIGLQLIGRPWAEASLLRLASAIEVSILIPTDTRTRTRTRTQYTYIFTLE